MRVFKKFNLGILSCIIAGLVVVFDLFYIFNYSLSTKPTHFLRLFLVSLFCASLGIVGLLKIKTGGNSKRSYWIIAGLVVIFDLFYVFNRTPSIDLMRALQLILLNFIGIAVGFIGLLKIKITGNGSHTYYVIGCILNAMLIIRHYVNGIIMALLNALFF